MSDQDFSKSSLNETSGPFNSQSPTLVTEYAIQIPDEDNPGKYELLEWSCGHPRIYWDKSYALAICLEVRRDGQEYDVEANKHAKVVERVVPEWRVSSI